jgi:predicted nucleic acid-binding protein
MIVVDTSVIVKFVVPEARSATAHRLRGQDLAAPVIWQAEAANVFWRKVQSKELTQTLAARLLQNLLDGAVETLVLEDQASDVFALAAELKHPVYDCFFLKAAISGNTFVVTDDARFARAVNRNGKWSSHIRLLKDFDG